MTQIRRLACLALLVLASLAPAAGAQEQFFGVRIRESSLQRDGSTRIIVSVAGPGTDAVLPPSAFTVRESGRTIKNVQVTPLIESKVQPVAVALVLDLSGSTRGRPLADARTAALGFLDQIHPQVPAGIVTFANTAGTRAGVTTDRAVLRGALDGLEAKGETALYDGIVTAAQMLGQVDAQRNMVVFTDGKDTVSQATLEQALESAQQEHVRVTTVALVTPDFDAPTLERIAQETGGRSIPVAASSELSEAFREVAREIASQYVLSYVSHLGMRELDLNVTARTDRASASDQVTVDNPRVVRPPSPTAPPEPEPVTLPAPGILSSRSGLYLGLAAAFLGLISVYALLRKPVEGQALKTLRRMAPRQKKQGVPEAEGVATTELARRVVSLIDQIPHRKGAEENLRTGIERAGWLLRTSEFRTLQAAGAVGGIVMGGGLFGNLGLALILAGLGAWAPRFAMNRRVERRSTLFLGQLPDTLQFISGSLQAGYAVIQAIDLAARESEPPTSGEFARVLAETRLGSRLEDALERMAERLGSEDFRWVVLAINIQRQVGGNLASLLDTVAATLREREQVRRQVRVLSAEGRLSALVLSVMPFVLAGYLALVNPDYLRLLFQSGLGIGMVVGGAALLVVGIVWLRRIVRIEV